MSFGSRWSCDSSDSEGEDSSATPVYEDGCDTYWSDIFGPALTRLTANQAANMLQVRAALLLSRHVGRCACIRCIVETVSSRMLFPLKPRANWRHHYASDTAQWLVPRQTLLLATAVARKVQAYRYAVGNACCKGSASIPVCCFQCPLQARGIASTPPSQCHCLCMTLCAMRAVATSAAGQAHAVV